MLSFPLALWRAYCHAGSLSPHGESSSRTPSQIHPGELISCFSSYIQAFQLFKHLWDAASLLLFVHDI